MYVQACFPDIPLSEARYCEWWTHNRPHSCGHQFHFDSDEPKLERGNGAIGDVTHPIFSTIIYLTEGLIGTYSFWTSRSLLHHPPGHVCLQICISYSTYNCTVFLLQSGQADPRL